MRRSREDRYLADDDDSDAPCAVHVTTFLMAVVLLIVGSTYLYASTLHERETELRVFEGAVGNWTATGRDKFARIVSLKVNSVLYTSPLTTGTEVSLSASQEPDSIYDEEGTDILPSYTPLKFTTSGETTDTFLPVEEFHNAAQVMFHFEVEVSLPSGGTHHSSFQTSFLPSVRIFKLHAPFPAPETKCKAENKGVYDIKSKMCHVFQRLDHICVQVAISKAGDVSLAPMLKGSPGSYGCNPAEIWSPTHYIPIEVEGSSTTNVVLPAVRFSDFNVMVRSEEDPFLHVEATTHGSNTFGLSSSTARAVGGGALGLGLLLLIGPIYLCRRALQKYARDRGDWNYHHPGNHMEFERFMGETASQDYLSDEGGEERRDVGWIDRREDYDFETPPREALRDGAVTIEVGISYQLAACSLLSS
ncbi:unnamed protein product [Chrysoparadoxa australica]